MPERQAEPASRTRIGLRGTIKTTRTQRAARPPRTRHAGGSQGVCWLSRRVRHEAGPIAGVVDTSRGHLGPFLAIFEGWQKGRLTLQNTVFHGVS